jgi:hypothetical protein
MAFANHRSLAAAALLATALLTTACSGTTAGEEGPVQVSSASPAAGAPVPGLGSAAAGGITLSAVSLRRSGSGIAVIGAVTSTHPDRLISIASNYTETAVLPAPVPVTPAAPTTIDPATVVLRPSGPIDDGATVSVILTFATAGTVQVFATYQA